MLFTYKKIFTVTTLKSLQNDRLSTMHKERRRDKTDGISRRVTNLTGFNRILYRGRHPFTDLYMHKPFLVLKAIHPVLETVY